MDAEIWMFIGLVVNLIWSIILVVMTARLLKLAKSIERDRFELARYVAQELRNKTRL